MISYEPLWITLVKQKKKKKDIVAILSPATVARMGRDEYISLELVDKICRYLDCEIVLVVKRVPDPEPDHEKENPEG